MSAAIRVGMTLRDHLKPVIVRARERGLLDCVEANISPYVAAGAGALLRAELELVDTPYAFHLTDGSVCSADFPTNNHCAATAEFVAGFAPLLVSDHFTACRVGRLDLDMNLPIVADADAVEVYTENVQTWRAVLATTGVPLALEHVPATFDQRGATMSQGEAYARVMQTTRTGILLDLHNAHCDERISGVAAERFLERLPLDQVAEVHLAGGHALREGTYFDGHSRRIPGRVFELLERTLALAHPRVIIIEREHDFTDLDVMLRDLERVREAVARC